jgi:hypothetical protein
MLLAIVLAVVVFAAVALFLLGACKQGRCQDKSDMEYRE